MGRGSALLFVWGGSLESPTVPYGGYVLVAAVVWEIWGLKAVNLIYPHTKCMKYFTSKLSIADHCCLFSSSFRLPIVHHGSCMSIAAEL